MVRQTLIRFFLHDLDDKGNSFCKHTVKEIDEGKMAMCGQIGRPSMKMSSFSKGALALRRAPEASAMAGVPHEKLWLDGLMGARA
jgi:hypothetical protein